MNNMDLEIVLVDNPPREDFISDFVSSFQGDFPTDTLVNLTYPFADYQQVIKTVVTTILAYQALNIYEISTFFSFMIAYYAMTTMKIMKVLNVSWMALTMATVMFHYRTNLVTSMAITYTLVKVEKFMEFIIDFLGIFISLVNVFKFLSSRVGRGAVIVTCLLIAFTAYIFSESKIGDVDLMVLVVILTASVYIFFKRGRMTSFFFYLMCVLALKFTVLLLNLAYDDEKTIAQKLATGRIRIRLPKY